MPCACKDRVVSDELVRGFPRSKAREVPSGGSRAGAYLGWTRGAHAGARRAVERAIRESILVTVDKLRERSGKREEKERSKCVHAVGESDAGVPKSSSREDCTRYMQFPVYLLVSS